MLQSQGKVLVKFYADWCAPCKVLTKIMSDIDVTVPVVEYNVDEDLDETKSHSIRGVPTLIMLEDGKEVNRISGSINRDKFLEFIK